MKKTMNFVFGMGLIFSLFQADPARAIVVKSDDCNIAQEILFRYDYINVAWGFQNWGWMIDRHGNAVAYRVSPKEKLKMVGEEKELTKNDIQLIYRQATGSHAVIGKKELCEKYALILRLESEKLSDPDCRGADMGNRMIVAYRWDDQKQVYRELVLNQAGDCNRASRDPQAVELGDWLEKVNSQIPVQE